jgi:transcription elongation factor GreA
LVSRQSFEAKQHEYELLITEKIPENKQAIVTAREHGDLRENSEYKMARQDQETLMAQKAQLEADLARAQITDFTDATDQAAGIGTVVTLKSAKGKVYTYTLLGAWDSDPDQHILSYQTPLAQQLLGKTVGDSIMCSLDGRSEEVCTLSQISRWVDVAGAKSRQKVKS